MKGISKRKRYITAALMASVMSFSTLPLGASAQSYHNDNNWRYQNNRHDNNGYGSSWRAHDVARRHHPGRGVVGENRYRNRDNDVIIIIIFVDGCHSYVRERDGAFLGSHYS
jgi:hypothetical protein